MSLPQLQSDNRVLQMMQSQWASQIDPVLTNPLVNGRLIMNVSLSAGDNTINTLLSRKLVGWMIVGQSASSSIFDKQASNQMSDKTLILNSSAPCLVNIWAF